jgi:3-deoxy-D-manno-octulosonate 8-phosphate phosphatase (KDO 8-P phosphatase)
MSRVPRRKTSRTPWRRMRALIMDVDGVLTDGGLYYTENGDELKRFDVRDGQGLVLLRQAGILTAIVTGKRTTLVARRADELGIAEVHQGVSDKGATVTALLARHGVALADACYVGDDINDLPALRLVGIAVAVADAVAIVRRTAHYVTRAPGGRGAIREVCDLILATRSIANGPAAPRKRRRS